jgi:hypothetical protein
MKKNITISELRQIVRSVLLEAPVPPKPADKPERKLGGAKALPPEAHTEKWRYRADGTASRTNDTVAPQDVGTAQTQMPPTMHPPTVPAKASNKERAMDQELRQKNLGATGLPKDIPTTRSPHTQKATMVASTLASKGIQADEQTIKTWLASMDPSDILVKTTEQLAADYMANGSNSASA